MDWPAAFGGWMASDVGRDVLVVAPSGADATVVKDVLARVGLETRICRRAAALGDEIRRGAGAAIIAEEAIGAADVDILNELLAAQADWSDLPVILLAAAGHDVGPLLEKLCRSASRHVSVLERPIRSSTLQAAAQAAIRSRERQYQVRNELERRRRAECALRSSEERLRLAAEAAQFGTYDVDLVDGDISTTLETRRILGAEETVEPLSAELLVKQIHPEDRQRVWDAMMASFDPNGVGVVDEEHRVVLPDGDVRWVMVRGRTTFDGEGRQRCAVRSTGTMIDITKRKRAEEQLKEADRRKDKFLATLAHELRNPMAALRISLDVVAMTEGRGANAAKSCQIMERQIETLVRLVDDLVDVSRIIQDKMQLRRARVQLHSVIERALEDSAFAIEEAGHELSVSVPPEPIELDADPVRLAQVFANLLSNAAKYTPRCGHIDLEAERLAEGVRVSVRDDGFGISAAQRETIFEMFGQAHGTLERGQKGLGIGLSLAKSLIEMHGGTIEVHSDGADLGSRFDVWLPVAESAGENANGGAPPERPRAVERRRVLVVDDNRDAAQALAEWMELQGHESRCAYDGAEALVEAARFRPQLVLLDIGLPKMTGYDVARRIRSEPWGEGMILAAISGWGRDADRAEAARAGFDRHLTKPPQPESLRALLDLVADKD